ncbi:MAG: recombination mediator RecR [Spirochaetales bacterium]|uniref:Recombination protein RecR n=1 Tax=Candidatus Thalassospirochaeta sargassi TaxID=3119039 RepID=A0AAJ1IBC7_9SPIO|nr:recombination mediator RecR [Spirochaetales bacterium]
MNALDQLVKTLSKLPGIGSKSARRVAHHLLKADSYWVAELASQIAKLQESVKNCEICGNYTEESPCSICSDYSRDRKLICVVEQPEDIGTIELTGDFNGLYHVLGGVISPIDGMGPEELSIGRLLQRLKSGGVEELIIATNPTVEGETTALYIVNLLKDSGLRISQLASGLPAGGDLEYADRLTISRSLKGRRTLLKPKESLKSIGSPEPEKPLF